MADYIGKPGSALESLIPDWAVDDKSGCGCKSWIKKMDQGGCDWTEKNRAPLVAHLVRQKKRLVSPMDKAPDVVCAMLANQMVSKAIRMATE